MPNYNRDAFNNAESALRSAGFEVFKRHYGGCNVNGVDYHYNQASDTLIREDVLKAELAEIKKAAADQKKKQQEAQKAFTEF